MYSPVTWVFLEQFPVYLHFCCWFNFQLLAFPSLDFKKQISLSYCCACLQGYHRDVLEHWAPPPPGSTTAIVHPPPPFVDQTPNKTTPEISTEVILSPPIKQILAKRGKEKKSSSKRHRKVAAGSRQISSR